ncbi:ABC transporter permease, partial [bacterium]|nr:ABC transporter permease [bacterium]
ATSSAAFSTAGRYRFRSASSPRHWARSWGTAVGIISGYFRGWVDASAMFIVDVQLSLPFLLLAIAVALVLGTSLSVLIGIAAFATWPGYTRVMRGVVLSLREREYVTAARSLGAGDLHIMLRHILPGLVTPLLVLGTSMWAASSVGKLAQLPGHRHPGDDAFLGQHD